MTTESMYQEIGIRPEVLKFGTKIEKSLKERFDRIDETAEYNQLKVIHAMQKTVSVRSASTSPAAMAITIWEERPWKPFMLLFSIRRALWSAPRSPVEPMPWPWPFPAIYGREMSFCPFPASPTTRWRRSSASGLPWAP